MGADESDDEEDFMSDKFLVDAASSSTSSVKAEEPLTYSEQRKRALHASYDKGQTKSRAEREKEARRDGLGRSLIETADVGAKRKQEDGAGDEGSNKALRMMMSMGFKPGQSLGRQGLDRPRDDGSTPLQIDDRWLGRGSRSGIGKLPRSSALAIVREIDDASSSASKEHEGGDVAEFRARTRESHDIRHAESLLRGARKTCEDLDRSEMAMTYSPLWLDPASLFKRQEDLPPDVAEVVAFAFAGLDDEKQNDQKIQQAEGSTPGDVAVRPLDQPSEEVDKVTARIERAKIARSFSLLRAPVRLQITVSHLRRAHSYCLFCGHRYVSQDELNELCPGEEEDDH
jgi:hypothetical protein